MRSISKDRPSVNPDLLTLKEASRLTGIPVAGLLILCRAGRLRYLRAGLGLWLRREDVAHLVPGGKGE